MKIIDKIKELWGKAKAKVTKIYENAEKWVGVFILEYKPEFLVIGVTTFAFIVDVFAGTRFNAFLAPVLIGFLIRSVVLQKKQADEIESLKKKPTKKKK